MNKPSYLSDKDISSEKERVFQFIKPKTNSVHLSTLKKRLQQIMQDKVFVFRDKIGLRQAIHEIQKIKKGCHQISTPIFEQFNIEWINAIEFKYTVEAAEIIAKSALMREESRGFHFRRDYPEEDNKNWLKHVVSKFEDGHLITYTVPVDMSRVKPGDSL
jgi:succinate dehydrogenase/fumarate reductase flavoprotein subunit